MERAGWSRAGIGGLLLATALSSVGSVSGQDAPEPFQKTCGTQSGLHVDVVGRKSDLLEVWDGGKLIIRDYTEARQSMGGGGIGCDDITVSGDLLVARLGHENDIMHAYYVFRGTNRKPYKVSMLVDRFRDGKLQINVNGTQIGVLAGERGDLRFTRCVNWRHEGVWGQSRGEDLHSGKMPECVQEMPTHVEYGHDSAHANWWIQPVDTSVPERPVGQSASYVQYGYSEVCTQDIPNGWIRVEDAGHQSKCDHGLGSGSLFETNAWKVVNLNRVPVGADLDACLIRVPDGWRLVRRYFRSGSCQNRRDSLDLYDNRMVIRRAQ